jgi:hypothetical protein
VLQFCVAVLLSSCSRSRDGELKADEKCAAVAYVTIGVTVTDSTRKESICDAEVSVVDDQQRPLRLQRGADSCSWTSFEGREGVFTVTARKAGYVTAQQQVRMRKLPCQYSADSVHLGVVRK